MFELSILRKYLIPRKKQLSVTLIAFLSVGVISAVVCLVLLFLSVTEGIEKTWLKKLTSIHAPIRITPTQDYFSSYYYLADTISEEASYTPRSFAEKLRHPGVDLYNPAVDESLPKFWSTPQKEGGLLKDPVMLAAATLKKVSTPLETAPFEMSGAVLRLQMNRSGSTPSFLTQASYLSSYPEKISHVQNLIVEKKHFKNEQEIVLAKGFSDSGVRIGDRGWIQYQASTAGALQEQRLPVIVAGFYDPGVMSIGNKCILAPDEIVHMIRTASPIEHFDKTAAMGFCVWHADLSQTKKVADEIQQKFVDAGISKFWKITTYHDYEFSKDLMQQFQSDRYLFTFLGLIILIVACSNIISFLILLVQDKKREIGILQALGASKRSIALIFGGCGATVGLLSSLLGIGGAYLVLKNLDSIVRFLSFLQGHAAFNAAFYGNSLPSEMSVSALVFVAIITPILSLIAGLIPAWKATKLTPSEILRSE